jgi:ubiquinone/menaquinone biosynthesis C-methylase UbiE
VDRSITLARQVLCCPDCQAELDGALACSSCGRSLAPEADDIISALPAAMTRGNQTKDQIQAVIDATGPDAAEVVLFEKAFHDEQASHYDKLFADPLPLREYYKRLVRRQIYSYVHRKTFVVDLCCGTGKSSMPLVERGIWVIGVDVSREMLRTYRRKASGYENLILVQADASHPPLRPNSCGAITMIGGLHHIPDRPGSVSHCCKSLAPGGILILHEPLKTGTSSMLAVLLEDLYAVTNPARVWKAIRRRLGTKLPSPPQAAAPCDFTPYERPFTSSTELLDMLPPEVHAVVLRSQGLLSFREFSPYLHGNIGVPFAKLIVTLDNVLSKRSGTNWSGDALFAVLEKRRI